MEEWVQSVKAEMNQEEQMLGAYASPSFQQLVDLYQQGKATKWQEDLARELWAAKFSPQGFHSRSQPSVLDIHNQIKLLNTTLKKLAVEIETLTLKSGRLEQTYTDWKQDVGQVLGSIIGLGEIRNEVVLDQQKAQVVLGINSIVPKNVSDRVDLLKHLNAPVSVAHKSIGVKSKHTEQPWIFKVSACDQSRVLFVLVGHAQDIADAIADHEDNHVTWTRAQNQRKANFDESAEEEEESEKGRKEAKLEVVNCTAANNDAANQLKAIQEEKDVTWRNMMEATRELQKVTAKLKKKNIDNLKCGCLYKYIDIGTALLYMGIIRCLAKALACTAYDTTDPDSKVYLIAVPEIQCWVGDHSYMAPAAVFGLCALYPTAMLTRPLFQALDTNLELHFDYDYLFVFSQLQTFLLVVSSFFPNSDVVLLFFCLFVDFVLLYYFATPKEVKVKGGDSISGRGACTAVPLNKIAVLAFGFSAWINICSLIICWKGNYYAPSIMMFTYLLIVVVIVIRVLQESMFPKSMFKDLMLNQMTETHQLQMQLSMRTECTIRFLDFLTGAAFFHDEVYMQESEEQNSVIDW
jgi:hypothetical protein